MATGGFPGLEPWLAPRMLRVDDALRATLVGTWPDRLAEGLAYPVFGGGKRVRPALVLAAFEAAAPGRDPAPALPPAAAIELVHTYSLVHDDLPCMDDDDVRRGRPTVHKVFGEAGAVLVGDGLLTEAFAVLARATSPAEVRIRMVGVLAEAAGPRGMIAGQAADVGLGGRFTALADVERLHAGKTGALLTAAAVLGGLAAEASPEVIGVLERYGRAVGLAFQLADDVLDQEEASEEDGPPSFVRLLGVEETRRRARALAAEAARTLPAPDALLALAAFIVDRDV